MNRNAEKNDVAQSEPPGGVRPGFKEGTRTCHPVRMRWGPSTRR